MNKAKEWQQEVDRMYANEVTGHEVKEMNHKTLEDVKFEAMLRSRYTKFESAAISMQDLDEILKKLKI